MAGLSIDIVSFNDNESRAVERFLDDLLRPRSQWGRAGPSGIKTSGSRPITIRHLALRAQGNVVAGARLAGMLVARHPPDFIVFYGCAGTLDSSLVGSAFLVRSVSYASLGTVEKGSSTSNSANESVTLKNKWLCVADGSDVAPLSSLSLGGGTVARAIDFAAKSGLDAAHVVATDKVIRVGPASIPPSPSYSGPPTHRYPKREWSYGEALAFVKQEQTQLPVLVEMESYGVAMVANAFNLLDRVLIIRIATDDLVGHASSEAAQRKYLDDGRLALTALVHTLVFPLREPEDAT